MRGNPLRLFAPRLESSGVVVVSPDAGGMKRAERLRELLSRALGDEASLAFLEKHGSRDRLRSGVLVGSVQDRAAIIIDDLIGTGGTVARAARACRERGADTVVAAVTHGLFAGTASRALLAESELDQLAVTNTALPPGLTAEAASGRLAVLDVAPLLAEAVRCDWGADAMPSRSR